MTELAIRDEVSMPPMTVGQLREQVNLIQHVMREVMQPDQHYGKIPGCGDKPTLLKSGAEKLGMVFRLAPRFEIERRDLQNGHREFNVKCILTHIDSGKVIGEGVGCGSTMESKYRYRGAKSADEPTDIQVPRLYWDKRKADAPPAELQKVLSDAVGLAGKYGTKKNDDGLWMIVRRGESTGEKVENPDIADVYNTVLKMAKKRAQVDAILTATAASDIFTQDIEDMYDAPVEAKPVQSRPVQQTTPREAPPLKQVVDGDDFEPDEAEQFIISLGEHFDLGDFTPEQRDVIVAKVCRRKKVKNIRDLSPADRKAMLSALADGKFDDVKSQEVVTA